MVKKMVVASVPKKIVKKKPSVKPAEKISPKEEVEFKEDVVKIEDKSKKTQKKLVKKEEQKIEAVKQEMTETAPKMRKKRSDAGKPRAKKQSAEPMEKSEY